jgi:hypothetical protein
MKNLLRTAALALGILWIHSVAEAQVALEPISPYRLGLSFSPNTAYAKSMDLHHEAVSGDARFGYSFIFDVMFTDQYAVGTGVNVLYLGSTVRYWQHEAVGQGHLLNSTTRKLDLQYIEVPITFKMRTKEIGYTTYFAHFGAGFGLNIQAVAGETVSPGYEWDATEVFGSWTDISDMNERLPDRIDVAENIRLFRPSMLIGGGIERRLTGTTSLVVGLSYNVGLLNAYDQTEIVATNAANLPLLENGDSVLENQAGGLPELVEMKGKMGIFSLSMGLMF